MIDLPALRLLAQAATPGPWKLEHDAWGDGKASEITGPSANLCEAVALIPHDDVSEDGWPEMEANQQLIVAMRNALPALLSRLEKAEAVVEAARAMGMSWAGIDMESSNNGLSSIVFDTELEVIDRRQAVMLQAISAYDAATRGGEGGA